MKGKCCFSVSRGREGLNPPQCQIIVFERGPHVSFANCGLPCFVVGEIVEQDSLLLQTPETCAPDSIWTSVRRAEERAKGFIPGSIHIPLDEVRARMDELPRNRAIVVHCLSGQRSYFACRILAQHGFQMCNLTGSYRTWKNATSADGN